MYALKPESSRSRWVIVCALAALSLISAVIFWHSLAASTFLRGYDAYYYAVQADFWFRTGRLRIPDSSVVLYAIGALQYFGISGEMAVRVWAAISLLLFSLTFILLVARCRSLVIAIALFAWALVSPSIAFIAVELPKTFALLVLMNIALILVTTERIRLLLLIPVLALMVACHKMALVYAGVFGLVLALRFRRLRVSWPRGRGVAYAALVAVVVCLLGFFLAGTLGRADLLRIKGTNLMPGLVSLLVQSGLPMALRVEMVFAFFVAAAALLYRGDNGRDWRERGLMALLLLTAFVPAFGDEPFNFGERFAVMFPYLALTTGAVLLRRVAFEIGTLVAGAGLAAALAASFFRLDYCCPERINPPYDRYAAVTEDLKQLDIPMLVLHRGMHFYYKYETRRDAFSYEPEPHWDKARVWRLVYGATPEELFTYLPPGCTWGEEIKPLRDRDYNLVREDCFAAFRAAIDKDTNPQLYALLRQNDMNPSKPRPAFLYAKHASDEPEEFPALPPGK